MCANSNYDGELAEHKSRRLENWKITNQMWYQYAKNESKPGTGNYRAISLIFITYRKMQGPHCIHECN